MAVNVYGSIFASQISIDYLRLLKGKYGLTKTKKKLGHPAALHICKSVRDNFPHIQRTEKRLTSLFYVLQEQWSRGQPVIVANVSDKLDVENLWSPKAFNKQFGNVRHDIVNTFSGRTIPKVIFSKLNFPHGPFPNF